MAPNGLVVAVEPKRLVGGCVAPKIDVVAGAVDVAVPNGLAVVGAGVPNRFVVGAVLVPNVNGLVDVAVAAIKNKQLIKIFSFVMIGFRYQMDLLLLCYWYRIYSMLLMQLVPQNMQLKKERKKEYFNHLRGGGNHLNVLFVPNGVELNGVVFEKFVVPNIEGAAAADGNFRFA